MSKIINDLTLDLDEELEEKLQWMVPDMGSFHILRQSIDARKRKEKPQMIYSVEVFDKNEPAKTLEFNLEKISYSGEPVLIVGSGPAGLFAALRLIERGIPCHLFEQGSSCENRLKKINRFWRYGEFDPKNNVGFGEGGAGLYSDGKLITRIKSEHIPYVMHRLVQFGAPDEIRYLSNPHVGSDRIRRLIPVMREYLQKNGCTIHFDSKVSKILTENSQVLGLELESGTNFKSPHVILACGHSSESMFQHLHEIGVFMEGKSFAMGLRIEHPQEVINKIQYRDYSEHPKLGPATYRLAFHDKTEDRGVYSFCMCPGGYVLSSGTEADGLVSNGMSNYRRNSPFANAAIVVSIDHQKNFGTDLFGGLKYQKQIEQEALKMVVRAGGTKELPAQSLKDFIERKTGEVSKSSSPSGVIATPLHKLYSEEMNKFLIQGLERFDKNMKGFIDPKAQFHGPESRTSCPIRITRDTKTLQSVSHQGLYPTGEGAGYAGGITSAACDGIRVAEAIVELVSSQSQSYK